ncbi:MAG: hypothetical protein WDW38_009715 [Sanguina aurantia]
MDLRQYLEQLPPIKRDKLYESVWTVQAVFRSLCPLAKSYVLRLLTLDSPFSQGFAASWVKPGSLKQHHTAMQQLQDLSIIQPDTELLASAGLLSSANGSVSERGFHFLLQPPDKQLWTILHEYIKEAEDQAGTALHGVLSFLLQLGFRRVGQALPLGGLAPWERGIAAHMMQLGLLYPFKGPQQAVAGQAGAAAGAQGHIIVESNYRVYGYTSSPVQIAILELFCRKHPHRNVAGKTPIVPEVVSDQLRLWEADTHRVRMDAATLYDSFGPGPLFDEVLTFANDRGLVLWRGVDSFAAAESAHDVIRDAIVQLRARLPT